MPAMQAIIIVYRFEPVVMCNGNPGQEEAYDQNEPFSLKYHSVENTDSENAIVLNFFSQHIHFKENAAKVTESI